uniref:UPAR/Ly6 domain-containing protein n=1 Tax=Trichuris muris TaxID=70415 RepID=A0A5S6QUY1_TRIMR
MQQLVVLSLLSLLLSCFPLVSSIECLICRRTETSLVPGSMANSVFVVDSDQDDCEVDPVHCSDEEQFCLAAWVELAPGHHWVQKGCISAPAEGNGIGCTLEPLRLKPSNPLLADFKINNDASMVVCICNNGDFCNSGSVRRTYEHLTLVMDNSSARYSWSHFWALSLVIWIALSTWRLIG